ncbi:unnamed protein product [Lactuca saligna]|uniref:F-box domain-containing protein n=1 Tax=Lactuca saligna TaxID=75948 RepID=A0AA36EAU9_LACSI|nr:unnamed protein product [Lactuca saligna]
MSETGTENLFSYLSDDVVLNIFFKIEDDPRDWSRLACVCTKFSNMIRTICWKTKCHQTIPSVVSDLLQSNTPITSSISPPGGWASLHKLSVCCPGLLHSGVLLENSDLGLERELGPDENYHETNLFQPGKSVSNPSCSRITDDDKMKSSVNSSDCSWSLYDDLYYDSAYGNVCHKSEEVSEQGTEGNDGIVVVVDFGVCKRRKICRSSRSHLASGAWNLSREQGNKLLASRFRGDCLYICDWPGCVHIEEKRNYMLFRGVFKDFKRSRVWRTIKDGNRSRIDLNCAYCSISQVYDLHAAFCLRPAYGFHDDGEPVVRAYVCENGHVSEIRIDMSVQIRDFWLHN